MASFPVIDAILIGGEQWTVRGHDDDFHETHSQFRWAAIGRRRQSRLHACDLIGRGSIGTADDGTYQVAVLAQLEPNRINVEAGKPPNVLFQDVPRFLDKRRITYFGEAPSTLLSDILSWVLPTLLFFGLWMFVIRRFGQGQGGLMSIGKSRAKIYVEKDTKVTFAEVAGVNEARRSCRKSSNSCAIRSAMGGLVRTAGG